MPDTHPHPNRPAVPARDRDAVTITARRDPESARRILTALPDWFGIPEAVKEYVNDVANDAFPRHDRRQLFRRLSSPTPSGSTSGAT